MIEIDLKDDELVATLNRLFGVLADKTPVMQDIGDALLASTEDRYDRGVGPDGSAWAPKSPATIARYERGPDRVDLRPLIRTGTMRRTLFTQANADQVEIGSNAIQAAVMQFGAARGAFGAAANGSPIPWGAIPARPFLGVSQEDRVTIVEIVEEWLETAAED